MTRGLEGLQWLTDWTRCEDQARKRRDFCRARRELEGGEVDAENGSEALALAHQLWPLFGTNPTPEPDIPEKLTNPFRFFPPLQRFLPRSPCSSTQRFLTPSSCIVPVSLVCQRRSLKLGQCRDVSSLSVKLSSPFVGWDGLAVVGNAAAASLCQNAVIPKAEAKLT